MTCALNPYTPVDMSTMSTIPNFAYHISIAIKQQKHADFLGLSTLSICRWGWGCLAEWATDILNLDCLTPPMAKVLPGVSPHGYGTARERTSYKFYS